ncbi:MAG: ATP-binding protein [Eubacterium sp.]|nr:ATP-binding protein [Eubacterium sp.]
MVVRHTELKKMEQLYEETGNRLVLLYGREGCDKEAFIRMFCKGKKYFYYHARKASQQEQCMQLGREIEKQYEVSLSKYNYTEFFNRIRSGNASKLVVIIDEFQYIAKRDEEFFKAVLKLKAKKLYPGPVMIVLASSSVAWAEQEFPERFADHMKKLDEKIKLDELKFIDMVRSYPEYSVSDCVKAYGILGGVSAYISRWDSRKDIRTNVCRHILSQDGYLFAEAERFIGSELRELAIYNTILAAIAAGHRKLNDLFLVTGFSRAKISVYMKNLAAFEVVEKVCSFETGGWENAQKGIYQIQNNYVNFWFRFLYPNLSDLYLMPPEQFYDTYIGPYLDEYMNRYFIQVCMEYLELLNMVDKLPIKIRKAGTWVGKTGNIDIIAQDSARNNLIGLCNWSKPQLTYDMCEKLFDTMKKAKLKSDHYYLFSARTFDDKLLQKADEDKRLVLVDMTQL